MKKPDIQICDLIESKMNEIILKINQTHDIFEADKLHSELRILDWILFQVCSNEIKKLLFIHKISQSFLLSLYLDIC
jgi:hypothetical protein